ncbi:MAG: hypothetical protein E1N59_1508, partial [Puniceicoccaceae bacterium 5H]
RHEHHFNIYHAFFMIACVMLTMRRMKF